jgi:hypothetical protein
MVASVEGEQLHNRSLRDFLFALCVLEALEYPVQELTEMTPSTNNMTLSYDRSRIDA